MNYGIFEDTMANMTFQDIKYYVDKNALVLLPLGVIEEHGPHLCLGTDIYISHIQCIFIKNKLEEKGYKVVLAPPFYWGRCHATGGFIGTFKIRKETAISLIFDIISSLDEFGFNNVYGINAHNDIEQNIACLEAFKEATKKLKINARYIFPQDVMHHYKLNGNEKYICPLKPQTINFNASMCPDVHAGQIETASMFRYYPEITNIEKAKSLSPVKVTDNEVMKWLFGGQTENLSPEGYLGAPADFERVEVSKYLNDISQRIFESILENK